MEASLGNLARLCFKIKIGLMAEDSILSTGGKTQTDLYLSAHILVFTQPSEGGTIAILSTLFCPGKETEVQGDFSICPSHRVSVRQNNHLSPACVLQGFSTISPVQVGSVTSCAQRSRAASLPGVPRRWLW